MKPKIKICGITNLIDAKNALNLGADYIGLNNISSSKRYISCKEIDEITAHFNHEEREKLVLLTDFDAADTLISLASNLQINIIQPYATLSTKDLVSMKSLGFQIFMPRAVGTEDDLRDLDSYRQAVSLVILDSKVTGELGGSGKSFDHDLFITARSYAPSLKLALAGGLTPDNVAEATHKCEPYMLDVSSGVESKPGIKSVAKMRDFIAASRI